MGINKFTIVCLLIGIFTVSSMAAKVEQGPTLSGLLKSLSGGAASAQVGDDDPDVYDRLDEYVSMFLRGAGVVPTVNNTLECVDATRDLARAMDGSIKNIISAGFNFDTYLGLANSLGKAQPTIQNCFNSSYDSYKLAASHIATFPSAGSFFQKMGLKVAYSFFDWYRLYYSMNNAVQKQNMTAISLYSGQVANVLLSFDSSLNGTQSELTSVQSFGFLDFVFELVYNFLDGAIFSHSVQVETCQKNGSDYIGDFESAIEEFKKHTETGLYNGVYAVAALFGNFYGLNTACVDGAKAALSRVDEYVSMMSDPFRVFWNLFSGYKLITQYLMDATECMLNMEAACLGSNAGNLFYTVFAKTK